MILFAISHNFRQKRSEILCLWYGSPLPRGGENLLPESCRGCEQISRYSTVLLGYGACQKNEQNKLSERFRKYFKKSWYLLMKPMEKFSDEEMDKLSLMFEIAPRLADAYQLKNEFLKVIRSDSSKTRKWICLNLATAPEHIATGSKKSWTPWMSPGQMASSKAATTK